MKSQNKLTKPTDTATEREIDIEVVSNSWRSLSDSDAFEGMIDAWSRKLKAAEKRPGRRLIDSILSRQLDLIDGIVDEPLDIKREDVLENAVSTTPAPAMVLSPEGMVVTMSEGAADFFGVEQGSRAGESWIRPDSVADFRAVRRSAALNGNVNYAILRIEDRSGNDALAEAYTLLEERHQKTYTVVRSLEIEWDDQLSERLNQAFDLTLAEAEICQLIFRHMDLKRVAEIRGVAIETVRTQLKRIFGKTEVGSQAELVRMLGLLCARLERGKSIKSLEWSDPLRNEKIFQRSDGRRLAYTWTGARDGTPILYVHSKIPFFLMSEDARSDLEHRNIKLICPSAPGNGNSDASSSVDQLEDGAAALIELADHLGLRRLAALASYGGQYYLARAALMRPELFRAMLIIGAPWTVLGQVATLSLTQQTFTQLARRAPDVFHLTCKICFQMLKREGPDWYLLRSYGQNSVDRATVLDPEVQPLLRAGCRHHFNQGVTAFVNEEVMLKNVRLEEWLSQLDLPIHWLVPETTLPSDGDSQKAIKALNPRITLEVVENAGQLLPFQRSALFAERLQQLCSPDPAEQFRAIDASVIA